MSKFQDIIGEALRHWFPSEPIFENFRPDWLEGLELDFYLPRLKLGIEVNGSQHYFRTLDFHKGPTQFRDQRSRDIAKRHICKSRGVVLLVCRKLGVGHGLCGLQPKLHRFLGKRLPRLPKALLLNWRDHAKVLRRLHVDNLNRRRQIMEEKARERIQAL